MVSSHVIVYSTGESLFHEIKEAVPETLRRSIVLHSVHDLTQLVDQARDLSPIAVVIDYSGDFDSFRTTIREVLSVSPDTVVAGAYHPHQLETTSVDQLFVSGVREGVQDFLKRPVSSSDLKQMLERVRRSSGKMRSSTATTVAFMSNKGGVGKSTLSVNTATRLAQKHPGEVLLIDASLQMGVCAPMLNLRPELSLLDAIRERERLDPTLIRQLATPHSSGLELLAAPPDAIAATEIDEQLMTRVLNLARRTYRYVIIDTFPLFDRIVMSVLDTADLAVIVLDNVVPTILSIRHLLELLDEIGHPEERQRIAVNRMTSLPGHPTKSDVESSIGRSVDYLFPFKKQVLSAANTGQPFALKSSWWSPLEKPLSALVAEIEDFRRVPARSLESENSPAISDVSIDGESPKGEGPDDG